jgi:sterol desaturase/sphingolipid hydroxylase (fatty acid hydroxylase superfamily)
VNIGAEIVSQETVIRFGFFSGIFLCMAVMEKIWPKRSLLISKPRRWFANLLMQLVNTTSLRLIFPVFPVGIALLCTERGWGLLNFCQVPWAFAIVAGILALDVAIYFQHVMFHATPLFWRLHMVHHTDQDIDVTTGVRFHPLEIILSLSIKMAVVAIVGAPALAVLIFEVLLSGASMFNHSNLKIPIVLDRIIRLLLVTPDMHRVHHSVIIRESNSNYGFSFSVWDRVFGTYRPQPADGHEHMKIGLNGYHDDRSLKFLALLAMPFSYQKRLINDE